MTRTMFIKYYYTNMVIPNQIILRMKLEQPVNTKTVKFTLNKRI
jgi:hypothetical protein